jgi:hypothetical protein
MGGMMRLLILFLASNLCAGEVKLVWDKNPPEDLVQTYIVYEHFHDTAAYVPIENTVTNAATLADVPGGYHCYVVTASNYWGESVFSNEACTLVLVENRPLPVTGTRFL